MEFNSSMQAAPRNTMLLMRHRSNGIGIGAIRTHHAVVPNSENVSFACESNHFGIGISMPTPVEITDFTGWAPMVHDKPVHVEKYDSVFGSLLKIRDDARFAATFCDETGMTVALEKIAALADKALMDQV